MKTATAAAREDYWDTFSLEETDVEFLYNHLLEVETPLTSEELLKQLIAERLRIEREHLTHALRAENEATYLPKKRYQIGQRLIFPNFGGKSGEVLAIRPGKNPDLPNFEVIRVQFEDGSTCELAANVTDHLLNNPIETSANSPTLNTEWVWQEYKDDLLDILEDGLAQNEGFVRIAGRWFPRALLININPGYLHMAEAVLEMEGGGPVSTQGLIEQVNLTTEDNPKLLDFSFDYALQNDKRFDEVGPAGEVLWHLHRLEPEAVRETPMYLRYQAIEHNRSLLKPNMLKLEQELDDELSPLNTHAQSTAEIAIRLIYPHLRAGTLPLSNRVSSIFPTAYEAPRVRFMLIDGDSGKEFPGWVVRADRYVYGLGEWYQEQGVIPGSIIRIRKGKRAGQVIVQTGARRASRDWLRTLMIGSDGGFVFANLRQTVRAEYDERMTIFVPDLAALDDLWKRIQRNQTPLERTVVTMLRELTKDSPQGHVHLSELYASVNLVRRCPPAPLMTLLLSRPWFTHVGDLHFRLNNTENNTAQAE